MKTTNSEGIAVDLRPNTITMVILGGTSEKHPDMPGFQVMGNRIHEQFVGDMDTFVEGLPNKDDFVRLVWVGDSQQFWVNVTQVKQVKPVDESMKIKFPAAQSDIRLVGGANRLVIEDPYDLCQIVKAHGGPVLDF